MTDIRFRPLDSWVGAYTPDGERRWADYAADVDRSMTELIRAFDHLEADEASVLVAGVKPSQIRMDGYLKASANPGPPVAVVLSTKHGALRFQSDRWHTWEANLRCIALTLDRLRLIDRDGCATGAQAYRGWLAIEATSGAATMTRTEAARVLCDATAGTIGEDPTDVDRVARVARSLYADAIRRHHPDVGGDPDTFRKLTQARDVLTAPLEIGAGRG